MITKVTAMFESIAAAPADAIFGLTEAFRADPNPAKINLAVGVYKDSGGVTRKLSCVKKAEQRLLENDVAGYLGIDGLPEYGQNTMRLLFRDDAIVQSGRAAVVQTPGGTGALRVAADFIRRCFGDSTVWLSSPTWANHPGIFAAAGVKTRQYAYYNPDSGRLDFDAMLASLQTLAAGDVVLLHGCCHNPTGVDLSPEQWEQVAQTLAYQQAVPLLDFAYQGFGDGLTEDAVGLHTLCKYSNELMVCSSFSKNFGLYRERVGALTIVAGTAQTTANVLSQVKKCVRTNYSNPPFHGAAVVASVLTSPDLRAEWEAELSSMRERINTVRGEFVRGMEALHTDRDFSFIAKQRGMFSYSRLSPEQVDRLRDEHSIYMVRSGRINVAGMNQDSIPVVCQAIASVL